MTLLDPPQTPACSLADAAVAGIALGAGRLGTLGLADLEHMALMNRVDTKFIFAVNELGSILEELGEEYRVLDIDGRVLHRYDNQYFDTADFDCYRSHHNADLPRFKFRHRHYVDTERVYFEVKKKTNQGRTVKVRVEVAEPSSVLSADACAMVQTMAGDRGWDASALAPSVRASFFRLSIARRDLGERATIDIGLRLELGGEHTEFDGLAICELKQSSFVGQSPLSQALKRRGVRPHRMTKYCLGVLSARPDVKANDFKPMVRAILDLPKPV